MKIGIILGALFLFGSLMLIFYEKDDSVIVQGDPCYLENDNPIKKIIQKLPYEQKQKIVYDYIQNKKLLKEDCSG